MKNIIFLLFICISARVFSQMPTWNSEVAEIVFNKCGNCHHDEGVAHFPLTNYAAAKDADDEILDAIENDEMPPWPPDPTYVHFTDERVLSEEEKNTLIDWVMNGAPKGPGAEPEPPTYVTGPQMTDIDKEVLLPEFTISENVDQYRSFVVHSDLDETRYISGFEYLPGNVGAVHHMLIYMDTSDESYLKDLEDPLPGFESNGADLPSDYAKLIGGWAPGDNLFYLPAGMGVELSAGSDIIVELHFAPGHEGETDETTINLQYSDAIFTRPVWIDPILFHFAPCFQEPLFYIPANTVQTFHEIFSVDYGIDLTLISVSPHMHLLGQTYWAFALPPDGGDTIPLIKIDDWDFHWQSAYQFQKLLRIPANTDFYGIATYDNTTANEDNPNDPPEDVWLGEQTTDEMMLCFFAYTFYLPGDENVILDSAVLNTTHEIETLKDVSVFPNPATDVFNIQFYDPTVSNYDIVVYDLFGREVFTQSNISASNYAINIADWTEGMYVIDISAAHKKKTFKVMKVGDSE
ncbi:MAG: T9SS type A sorting domain-containing protein [Fimbriimonadaceae bacterium]|nr:T9SS type A sorting domain-containing protein [Chitinophagales bacterium]